MIEGLESVQSINGDLFFMSIRSSVIFSFGGCDILVGFEFVGLLWLSKIGVTLVLLFGWDGIWYLHFVLPFLKQLFLCRQSWRFTRSWMHAKSSFHRSISSLVKYDSLFLKDFQIKLSISSSDGFGLFKRL